ncbi:MAG: IS481 family transposase [Bradyrhizobiaceae bacterium]|nr:IS481 family transposase [Bradyrhizobiaceae bacterium]
MDVHQNARLAPKGREDMVRTVVDGGASLAAAARQFNTTPKTVRKWVRRFRAEGLGGLQDRSSRPHSMPSKTPISTCDAIEVMRRQRHTQAHIAAAFGVSPATVSRVLKPRGLSLLSALEPQPAPRPRYERATPGEIIHLDTKKLARFRKVGHRMTGDRTSHTNKRGVGWEFVHVAIDDHSRFTTAQISPTEKASSAIAFLEHAVEYYRSLGITVSRVMTDNGSCYRAKDFARACARLAIKHLRTKPYTPQTNGKAERFIQTALREWAYATAFEHSDERRNELPVWLHRYNWHRPHASLAKRAPISRLGLTGNNLLQTHT